jgi:LAO/AO transport system kinase
VIDLVPKAIALDKWSLGRLISLFEDTRAEAALRRAAVLEALAQTAARRALFVGITGTPGSGKSTLVGELAVRLAAHEASLAVAVLAIDPSSHVSGGALLGDRTRVRFPAGEQRLFFRSQASDRDLGGVGRGTFQVCRLLRYLFDVVFIETVGIGQSEVEIQQVADWTYLVLQPMAGDQVQFMKAGIMEIPDVFVLNKCDQVEAAERAYHALEASLRLARLGRSGPPVIHRTSALTGAGLDVLVDEIQSPERVRKPMHEKERYFLEKWVRDQYGRVGLARLAREGGVSALLTDTTFEAAQTRFESRALGDDEQVAK